MRKITLVIVSAMALFVSACAPQTGTATVSPNSIVTAIQTACGFKATAQEIQAIAQAIATSLGQGAIAGIGNALASQVENQVCDAVKTALIAEKKTAASDGNVVRPLTIVVAGQTVTGTYGGNP